MIFFGYILKNIKNFVHCYYVKIVYINLCLICGGQVCWQHFCQPLQPLHCHQHQPLPRCPQAQQASPL